MTCHSAVMAGILLMSRKGRKGNQVRSQESIDRDWVIYLQDLVFVGDELCRSTGMLAEYSMQCCLPLQLYTIQPRINQEE